jgi:hypothetical protein
MQKDNSEWIFKGVTVAIPIAAFVIAVIHVTAGSAIPLLVIGWFGYLARRAWGRRKG